MIRKTSMLATLRFRFAQLLDRLYPNACWADLCVWGMGDKPWDEIDWNARQYGCRRDIEANGQCWCGKMKA